MAGSLIRLLSPPFHNQPSIFTNAVLRLFHLFGNLLTGRKMSSMTPDKAGHKWIWCWLFFPPEHSAAPRSRLMREARGLAFRVDSVHRHGRLQVVAVVWRRVVQAVVVELVTQERGGLGRGVQLQVLVVVSHVHPGRQGVIGARRVFTVFLWAHGAVT